MTLVGNLGETSPYEDRDAAALIGSMRQLKEHAGLTYRELEERAAENGDVLARSTLADLLRRTTLPRPDVLAAFVRACGDGQRLGAWLDARDRIAADASVTPGGTAGPVTGAEVADEAGGEPEPGGAKGERPHHIRGRQVVPAACVVVAVLLASAAWLFSGRSEEPSTPTARAPGSRTPADGWVTIHPARTPGLCLTDGRDRRGSYGSAVAVQLPCVRATVPRTYLEPVGDGLYRIQWHHPENGKGCLTVMSAGPVKGMLEPREDCAQATLVRLEPTAVDSAGVFLLRPASSDECIGIADNSTAEGAEATGERCTGATDQWFRIRKG
ncbi:helix-turn-helix domain-containing protein [Streptomyces cyaneofuscatus]|uniref:helix-turn-helix domain-containing protein n=1 Tax=Streptomyces cyaneofuscatus TaxID=66883 RepID=UPI0036477D15